MNSFSKRHGIEPADSPIQRRSMDDGLRNGPWSAFHDGILSFVSFSTYDRDINNSNLTTLCYGLWHNFLKKTTDTIPIKFSTYVSEIRKYYFKMPWNKVYEFIEEVMVCAGHNHGFIDVLKEYANKVNSVLIRDNSAYRLIDGVITEIIDCASIDSITSAIQQEKFVAASDHIRKSMSLLYNRDSPDYQNSMKEAISSVESACREITGNPKAQLGQAIKVLDAKIKIHPALQSAFSNLYGFTSDAGGIRHAMSSGGTEPTQADAQLLLCLCSAFINYLIQVSPHPPQPGSAPAATK
jgi:hypothetical protein